MNRFLSASTPCRLCSVIALVILITTVMVPNAAANLTGTVLTSPGDTVFPGFVASGTNQGTLLASLVTPYTSTLGSPAGTFYSAVYLDLGGTLDFYYQVTNLASDCGGAPGQVPCDSIARLTGDTFLGFTTSIGFRLDGGTFPGPFVAGTVIPVTGDRNAVGDVVGFSFNPPDSSKIQPGQVSSVLVISTDAINFAVGNAFIIDGGTTMVASFEPACPPTGCAPPTPEPSSILLLATGLLGAAGAMRRKLLS